MIANGLRAVSWDVDGTLYRLDAMRRRLGLMALRAMASGRVRNTRRELRDLRERTALVERARAAGGVLDVSLAARCLDDDTLEVERRWLGGAIGRTGPRADVLMVLDLLATRRLPLVAISDYVVDYKLEALGLSDRFTAIVEGVRLGCVKPNPALFERAASVLGLPAGAILHVGDREDTDGAGARAAGFQARVLGRRYRLRDLASELQALV
jgi:FMN phosphatase YigB (HAD superfamily)